MRARPDVRKILTMKKILLISFLVCSPLIAQDAKVTMLMAKPLKGGTPVT